MSGRKRHACSTCIRRKKKCLCDTNQNRTPLTTMQPKRARQDVLKYTPTTILSDYASSFLRTKRKQSRAREARRMERQKAKRWRRRAKQADPASFPFGMLKALAMSTLESREARQLQKKKNRSKEILHLFLLICLRHWQRLRLLT